ncbi:MAG: hypothetical protein ABIO70_30115 [Pseudomonadota bacterium]
MGVLGAVAALFGVATAVVTWPVAIAPRSMLIGHAGNDTWNHVWGFWWVAQEVLVQHRWPGWTDLQAWPDGGALYFIDTFNALAGLPIQALFGPVVTHNFVVAGSLWFSAMAAWALARHLTRDPAAALVAGVAYGFCPHILAQAHNGITESLDIGWLALYLLALLRLLDEPRLTRGLAAWAALAACGVFNWYYGLFAGLITPFLLGWRAWRTALPWRRIAASTAFGGVLVGPLAAAALWALKSSMDAPDALVNRDADFVWNSLIFHNMTDLQCLFRPGRFYSPDLYATYGEELIIVVYVGWVLLALSAAAWITVRPRGPLVPWGIIAGVFAVFCLGPYLYAFGHYPELGGHRLPLPFLAFFRALPLFSRISHPFRFVVGVELALGVTAALGLAAWLRGRPRALAWVVGLAAAGAVLAETSFASPAVVPVAHADAAVPEGYQHIVEDPEPGAVLDLPIGFPLLERAVYNWYQVTHKRPIPYTLNEPLPPGLKQNQLARFILDLEASRARLLPRTLPDLELVVSARVLARQGYRWVVVHDRLYPELKREQVNAVLTGLFGPPTYEDGELTIYRIP